MVNRHIVAEVTIATLDSSTFVRIIIRASTKYKYTVIADHLIIYFTQRVYCVLIDDAQYTMR